MRKIVRICKDSDEIAWNFSDDCGLIEECV